MKTILAIILLAALLTGCAGKHFDIETSQMMTNAIAPFPKPSAAAPQPPAPPGLMDFISGKSILLPPPSTNPPQPITLEIAWDIYTNTAATALAVQGATIKCGPWTNEAVYSPPNITNQFTGTYSDPQHFLRIMVQ